MHVLHHWQELASNVHTEPHSGPVGLDLQGSDAFKHKSALISWFPTDECRVDYLISP